MSKLSLYAWSVHLVPVVTIKRMKDSKTAFKLPGRQDCLRHGFQSSSLSSLLRSSNPSSYSSAMLTSPS